jgi:hypothetical protein
MKTRVIEFRVKKPCKHTSQMSALPMADGLSSPLDGIYVSREFLGSSDTCRVTIEVPEGSKDRFEEVKTSEPAGRIDAVQLAAGK